MLRLRERARALASSLLIASWAVGSAVLPVAHPCVAADAVVVTEHADHGAHAGHGTPSAPTDHGDAHCTCIGACHAPASLAPVTTSIVSSATVRHLAPAAWHLVEWRDAPSRLADRLPPSTAPPIA